MSGTSRRWSSKLFLLRTVFTVQALAQLYGYAAVTLYAITWGGIDFLLPIKLGFGVTVASSVLLPLTDLNTAWRNRGSDWGEFGMGIYRLALEFGSVILLYTIAAIFLPQPYSNIDLRGQSPDAKWVILIGVASLVVFTAFTIYDLDKLRRAGSVPTIAGTRAAPQTPGGEGGTGVQ